MAALEEARNDIAYRNYMTKAEFKRRWESNENGGGITFDDVADCAAAWGLYTRPKCCDINEVLAAVLKAAGIDEEDERKEGKHMAQLVFILGRSGTGKSYSLYRVPKNKLALINVQNKILPFRGSAEIEQTATDDSSEIIKALDIYAEKYDIIVIDDFQYLMSNEFMRRSYEKGYDKFTEIARHAWDIPDHVRKMPNNVIVYIMCHTDRDDEGNEKIKTIGKLLDEKICLEGLSTIVLKTNVSDGQYTFLTQNNGRDTVKSPAGMFPTYAIANDLWYVDQKIRNYYGMEGAASDEEMAAADQEVAKPEVKKPDADGRKRRTRPAAAVADTPTVDTSTVDTPTDDPSHPFADDVMQHEEEPKQRRRKDRNGEAEKEVTAEAPAEEKKEETGRKKADDSERENRDDHRRTTYDRNSDTTRNEVSEETGRKRRRRKVDPEFSRPVAVEDDELPFD